MTSRKGTSKAQRFIVIAAAILVSSTLPSSAGATSNGVPAILARDPQYARGGSWRTGKRGLGSEGTPTSAPHPVRRPATDNKKKEGEGEGSTTSGGVGGGSDESSSDGLDAGASVDEPTTLTPVVYLSSTPSSINSQSDSNFLLSLFAAALGLGFIVAIGAILASSTGCSSCLSFNDRDNDHQLKGSVKKRMLIFSHMIDKGGSGADVEGSGPGPKKFDNTSVPLKRDISSKIKRSIGSKILAPFAMKKLKRAASLKRVSSKIASRDVRGRSATQDSAFDEDLYVRAEDGRMAVRANSQFEDIIDADAYARVEDEDSVDNFLDVFSPGKSSLRSAVWSPGTSSHRSIYL